MRRTKNAKRVGAVLAAVMAIGVENPEARPQQAPAASFVEGKKDDPIPFKPGRFEEFHKMVRPRAAYGESEYMESVPWAASLAEACRRSMKENKPIWIYHSAGDARGIS